MSPDFINLANIIRNEYLLKTEALFVSEKVSWLKAFAEHLQVVCDVIRVMQHDGALSAVSYLEYTMLYTNFVKRRYIAEARVYGVERYFDKKQLTVGEYDISFFFIYFDRLWDELLAARKRFVGQVTAQEVTAFMLEALPDFYSYLINIARFAIAEHTYEKPFTDISKNDVFMVSIGDYMAKSEPVFIENRNKDAILLADWFSERLANEYTFGDYSCLDFTGRFFANMDFRYARFNGSLLNNVTFQGSALVGANFQSACMEGCRLDNCSIHEANFSYANLKNTSFVNTNAKAGLPNEKEWTFAGFLPVSFKYADLRGADLRGADLTGADFTGAILDGAVFNSANMPSSLHKGAVE